MDTQQAQDARCYRVMTYAEYHHGPFVELSADEAEAWRRGDSMEDWAHITMLSRLASESGTYDLNAPARERRLVGRRVATPCWGAA